MYRCKEIRARVRMEERYECLSLLFGDNSDLKIEILDVIAQVKKDTGQTPFIFDKISTDRPEFQSIYIEFQDDIHREAGDFFVRILEKLDIDKCEE